jgi:hypothetical protein
MIEQAEDFTEFLPEIVDHRTLKNHLWCARTKSTILKKRSDVAAFLQGKRGRKVQHQLRKRVTRIRVQKEEAAKVAKDAAVEMDEAEVGACGVSYAPHIQRCFPLASPASVLIVSVEPVTRMGAGFRLETVVLPLRPRMLCSYFEQFGVLSDLYIPKVGPNNRAVAPHKRGTCKGHALVAFENEASAAKSMQRERHGFPEEAPLTVKPATRIRPKVLHRIQLRIQNRRMNLERRAQQLYELHCEC